MILDDYAERFRQGERLPLWLDWALAPASWAQRSGMRWRRTANPVVVDARVISYGNLTVGGVGKTPAVIGRAEREIKAGHRVAVLTRGYGAPPSPTPEVLRVDVPGKVHWPDIAARYGDEPTLIARRVPGVAVIKCGDRVLGARAAIAEGCDTLILDDGYQALALARIENALLVDASAPFGNGRVIPRGILREPVREMRRATHVILTHCDRAKNLDALLETVARYAGVPLVSMTCHAPTHLWRLSDGERLPLSWLQGRDVTAACAIARPARFFETIETLGAHVSKRIAGRDHAHLRDEALGADRPVILTEKDAVRTQPADNRYALAIDLQTWRGCGEPSTLTRTSAKIESTSPAVK